ncbi:MAG: AgmX/PglI C-terminal domain-containing protein [Myxococcota bacterium]
MDQPRALRVALVQHGRIVEDRTFPGKVKISVGSDERCTFLVPMAEVPPMTPVFDVGRHGTTLLFEPGVDGRVALDGTDAPLSELEARAPKRGRQHALPLTAKARGRVSIGEVSLLFQFVEPPKAPVRAALPKGSRGLLAQVDRGFLVVLGLSLAAHFAGVGWISSQPVPEERDVTIDEYDVDRFAKVVLPLPKPKPTPPPASTGEGPKTAPTKEPAAPARRPVAARPSQAEVNARVKTLGLLGIIGARGEGRGAVGDVLSGSANDVAEALRGARQLTVATVDDATALRRRGADTGETDSIDLPGTEGVKHVKLVERQNTDVVARVETEPVEVSTGFPDERELSRWLNQRKAAVQSCYERELKRLPSLHGRLVIRFVVTPRGRVDDLDFAEDSLRSKPVEDCISGLMRNWVLPFAPADDVPVSLPFIFSAAR